LESKNNSIEGSQVPRSIKYLKRKTSASVGSWEFRLQKSAEHHQYHDDEEAEGKERVL